MTDYADGMDASASIAYEGEYYDDIYYPEPDYMYYYVPEWVKAVIAVLVLFVLFFIEFHTTDTMYKWFVTSAPDF